MPLTLLDIPWPLLITNGPFRNVFSMGTLFNAGGGGTVGYVATGGGEGAPGAQAGLLALPLDAYDFGLNFLICQMSPNKDRGAPPRLPFMKGLLPSHGECGQQSVSAVSSFRVSCREHTLPSSGLPTYLVTK